MQASMITTGQYFEGYKVTAHLGVVRGIVVRSRSFLGTFGGALQTIVGGNISLFTELCERTRADAFNQMVEHADALRANAILSVRYDSNEIMNGVTEVLCYGTAVTIQPL